jgi:hypothetical protein
MGTSEFGGEEGPQARLDFPLGGNGGLWSSCRWPPAGRVSPRGSQQEPRQRRRTFFGRATAAFATDTQRSSGQLILGHHDDKLIASYPLIQIGL